MIEPLRALVVDDIPANRLVAEAMLSELGWSVMTAVDGRDAMNVLDAVPFGFDLVILDISMPGMSGIEMCQKIRANSAYAELPVIAYTAHAQPEDRRNFIASGFNEVLTKPINRATLVSAVASATQHQVRNRPPLRPPSR
jgi:CheY-like chemotaxis protein